MRDVGHKVNNKGVKYMKIAIVGAGAMGSLYGGLLANSNNEVYLIDIWEEHVNKINEEGLTIIEVDGETYARPKALTNSEKIGPVDLVIIFVKSIYTKDAIKSNFSIINEKTVILSLQNGYGNAEDIAAYANRENVIIGTTSHGATMIEPGKIRHAGLGPTYIGKLTGAADVSTTKVRQMLQEAGFETIISENVMELVWSKLLVNVGINAITAILGIKNGQLLDWKETKELVALAVTEAVQVAKGLELNFDEEETIENVMRVAKNTTENRSSMLQDVTNKRKTEIDKINGAIVKEGAKLGINTPVNLVVTNLIKVMESNY